MNDECEEEQYIDQFSYLPSKEIIKAFRFLAFQHQAIKSGATIDELKNILEDDFEEKFKKLEDFTKDLGLELRKSVDGSRFFLVDTSDFAKDQTSLSKTKTQILSLVYAFLLVKDKVHMKDINTILKKKFNRYSTQLKELENMGYLKIKDGQVNFGWRKYVEFNHASLKKSVIEYLKKINLSEM